MAKEGNIPPQNNGRKEASSPMEHEKPSEILLVERMVDFPLFPIYLFLLVFFKVFNYFCLNKLCYNDFQYPFKPKGAGTFSTVLNFMEEHSDYAVCYYYYKTTVHNVDRPNNEGRKFKQVHKMDENKSTKWMDLTKG